MFQNCTSLQEVDISSVTDMTKMFQNCTSLQNINYDFGPTESEVKQSLNNMSLPEILDMKNNSVPNSLVSDLIDVWMKKKYPKNEYPELYL